MGADLANFCGTAPSPLHVVFKGRQRFTSTDLALFQISTPSKESFCASCFLTPAVSTRRAFRGSHTKLEVKPSGLLIAKSDSILRPRPMTPATRPTEPPFARPRYPRPGGSGPFSSRVVGRREPPGLGPGPSQGNHSVPSLLGLNLIEHQVGPLSGPSGRDFRRPLRVRPNPPRGFLGRALKPRRRPGPGPIGGWG